MSKRTEQAPPKRESKAIYSLTDHICRACNGRVLQMEGNYVTGGGNPIYECADCGNGSSGISPNVVCWCGMHYRGEQTRTQQHICVAFSRVKEEPWLEWSLRSHGYDPSSNLGQIGVASPESIKFHKERHELEEAKKSQ